MSDVHDRYAFELKDDGAGAVRTFLRTAGGRLLGLALIAMVGFAVASLATWRVDDPSFSFATDRAPQNVMGFPGSAFADLAAQFLGLATLVAILPAIAWGWLLVAGRPVDRKIWRLLSWAGCIAATTLALACLPVHASWPLPSGLGGVIGDMLLRLPAMLLGRPADGVIAAGIGMAAGAGAAWLFTRAAIWSLLPALTPKMPERQEEPEPFEDWELDDPQAEPAWRRISVALFGAATHMIYKARASARRSRAAHAERRLDPPRLTPANDRATQREPAVDWNDGRERALPDTPPDGLLIDEEDAAYLEDRDDDLARSGTRLA